MWATWWWSKGVLRPLLYAGLQVTLHIHGRGSRREVHIQQQLHGERILGTLNVQKTRVENLNKVLKRKLVTYIFLITIINFPACMCMWLVLVATYICPKTLKI